jgi:hypothetical protein
VGSQLDFRTGIWTEKPEPLPQPSWLDQITTYSDLLTAVLEAPGSCTFSARGGFRHERVRSVDKMSGFCTV